MTKPSAHLTRMIVFLALFIAVVAVLHKPIWLAFATNPALNGLILGALFIGIAYVLRQVLLLWPAIEWVEVMRSDDPETEPVQAPPMMVPLAAMMSERGGRVSLSALSQRSLLDSIGVRLDESREIARYLGRLLIFLGLLGTFWGLIQTIASLGAVISSLTVESSEFGGVFDNLVRGLERPLEGMATAFSSSLFGLSGALVLGFLDLQAGQAQNRFYNDLEDWLAGLTRLTGTGGVVADGDQGVPAYVQALLAQTADSLENLQRIMSRSEDTRAAGSNALLQLSERLAGLTDQMRGDHDLMVKLAEGQTELKPLLQRIAAASEQANEESGVETHLRNLDVYVTRLVEESAAGRRQTVDELRNEIKILTRTLANIADERR